MGDGRFQEPVTAARVSATGAKPPVLKAGAFGSLASKTGLWSAGSECRRWVDYIQSCSLARHPAAATFGRRERPDVGVVRGHGKYTRKPQYKPYRHPLCEDRVRFLAMVRLSGCGDAGQASRQGSCQIGRGTPAQELARAQAASARSVP